MPLPKAPVKKAPAKGAPVAKKTAPAAKKPPVRKAAPGALTAEDKKKMILFKAPSDFKPFFMELNFVTLKDGMIGTKFQANRVKGRWDNPEAKRFNMMEYDLPTVISLMARISARSFAVNPLKRLTANKSFGLVLRVSKSSATGTINVSLSGARRTIVKDGKTKWVWFSKEKNMQDPDFKKLRGLPRFLRGAFVETQLPPSGRQPKKSAESDE